MTVTLNPVQTHKQGIMNGQVGGEVVVYSVNVLALFVLVLHVYL